MSHLILKQTLELQLRAPLDGQAVQREVTGLIKGGLAAALGDALDAAAPADRTLCLDRLTLDLGTVPARDYLQAILARFKEEMPLLLQKELGRPEASGRPTGGNLRVRSLDETMRFLLLTGNLPWWVPVQERPELGAQLTDWLRQPGSHLPWLQTQLAENKAVRMRVTAYLQDEQLAKELLPRLYRGPAAGLTESLIVWQAAFMETVRKEQPALSSLTLRQIFWSVVMACTAQTQPVLSLPVLRERLIAQLAEAVTLSTAYLTEGFTRTETAHGLRFDRRTAREFGGAGKLSGAPPDPVTLNERGKETTPNLRQSENREEAGPQAERDETRAAEPAKAGSPAGHKTEHQPNASRARRREDSSGDSPDHKSAPRTLEPAEDENVYDLDNAGLVLLHPLVGNLFREMKLVEGRDFIDETRRNRAVHLLQTLVTGEPTAEEWMCPLNKVLCGLHPHAPLPAIDPPGTETIDACEALLTRAIEHWSALKNTSVNGLRNTFLQRQGRLYEHDSHWLLRVEPKPFDLLLDHLPWGISLIRFTWMDRLLQTDWA
ncbi:MAG: contractile injection system tape measure protein [Acidobacteriota bacterium]|nr:contractile injection system tape measure protein [Acidobacteriota bacterium]